MQRLVKYIGMTLLLLVAMAGTVEQKYTESQEALPQGNVACYIHAEKAAAERTIAHLFAERLATPAFATVEFSGSNQHSSKSKSLPTIDRLNRCKPHPDDTYHIFHQQRTSCFHVIDYYIYTLGHILI